MKYFSTKTYGPERGFTVAYRQWRADSHCKFLHGYALGFKFDFEADTLDARNWVTDFGSLRTLRERLEEWFDHTCLVAEDDPEFAFFEEMSNRKLIKMIEVSKTGCEGLAEFLIEYVNDIWLVDNGYSDRVTCTKVEVFETPANSGGALWKQP